jgi:hypothetical protein
MGSQPGHSTRRLRSASPRASTPKSPRKPSQGRSPSSGFLVGAALASIRGHLETLHAVAEVAYAALQAQSADVDRSTAIVLQRCVLNPLAEEIARIEKLISSRGAA